MEQQRIRAEAPAALEMSKEQRHEAFESLSTLAQEILEAHGEDKYIDRDGNSGSTRQYAAESFGDISHLLYCLPDNSSVIRAGIIAYREPRNVEMFIGDINLTEQRITNQHGEELVDFREFAAFAIFMDSILKSVNQLD